jgi:hypothetical protein
VSAALEADEPAPRDAVQPPERRAAIGRIAMAPLERRGEGLGGQVGRGLGVGHAPAEVGEHAAHVPAVEPRERLRVLDGGDQQRVVVDVGLHAPS